MATATARKKSQAEQDGVSRNLLVSRGAELLKREDRHGETKGGWWIDDVFLGKTVKDAIESLGI